MRVEMIDDNIIIIMKHNIMETLGNAYKNYIDYVLAYVLNSQVVINPFKLISYDEFQECNPSTIYDYELLTKCMDECKECGMKSDTADSLYDPIDSLDDRFYQTFGHYKATPYEDTLIDIGRAVDVYLKANVDSFSDEFIRLSVQRLKIIAAYKLLLFLKSKYRQRELPKVLENEIEELKHMRFYDLTLDEIKRDITNNVKLIEEFLTEENPIYYTKMYYIDDGDGNRFHYYKPMRTFCQEWAYLKQFAKHCEPYMMLDIHPRKIDFPKIFGDMMYVNCGIPCETL